MLLAAASIDLAHLDRATFGDRALRREVLVLFERQAAALGAEIAAAPDGATRAKIAHHLRGAALGIGAMAVAEAAAAFEPAPADAVALARALSRLMARIAEARAATTAIIERD